MNRNIEDALQLNRWFLPSSDVSGVHDTGLPYDEFLRYQGETWDQILKRQYVVVLGEAGTGKSTEFLLQTKVLQDAGEFALFVELVDLARDGLAKSIDPEDGAKLQEWLDNDRTGTLFLDSLDEAKLQNQTLRKALRNLRHELLKVWDRVHLVISCRPSDWRAEADREDIQNIISSESNENAHVVYLAPLDTNQVEQIANKNGILNASTFIQNIKEKHAHEFIERPLDVHWLTNYWRKYNKIGNLSEIIQYNIKEKIKETNTERKDSLASTKIEIALRALAGIATIINHWSFLIPDESFKSQYTNDVIDPKDVLPDWSKDEIESLLSRAIFDEATYGRVRFHHRSVQEFLAGQWLYELLNARLSRTKLDELFIRQVGNHIAVPANLRPVAAWLALWDERIRSRLIKEMPSLLIEHGDPTAFPDDTHKEILKSYAVSYGNRKRRFDQIDNVALRRFSTPVLADPIEELLNDPNTPNELAIILLRLIRLGNINACADISLSLALDPVRPNYLREYAIISAAAVGNREHRQKLMSLLSTVSEWDEGLAGAFIESLYPDPLDIDNLINVLDKTIPKPRNVRTSFKVKLEHDIIITGNVEFRLGLLTGLLEKLWIKEQNGEYVVPDSLQWLLPMVSNLFAVLLESSQNIDSFPPSFITVLELFRWCRKNDNMYYLENRIREIQTASLAYPEIRRRWLWKCFEDHRKQSDEDNSRFLDLTYHYGTFAPHVDDKKWLSEDAINRPDMEERLLAFEILILVLSQELILSEEDNNTLNKIANQSPQFTELLHIKLEKYKQIFSSNTYSQSEIQMYEEEQARKREMVLDMKNRINGIRNGTDIYALQDLCQLAARNNFTSSSIDISNIVESFGADIADALDAGVRSFWRTFKPVIPSNKQDWRMMPSEIRIGLIGITQDILHGLSLTSLNQEEVQIIASYAACESNNFPSWFEGFINVYKSETIEVIRPAIIAEFEYTGKNISNNIMLHKIAQASKIIRAVFAKIIIELLYEKKPSEINTLRYALQIISDQENLSKDTNFDEIATERCNASISDPERFSVWWCGWLIHNRISALVFLKIKLQENDDFTCYNIILQIGEMLGNDIMGFSKLMSNIRKDPATLEQLIIIFNEYIKREKDDKKKGGWMNERNHAEQLRDGMIRWLTEIPGVESIDVLKRLSENDKFNDYRDPLLHMLEQLWVKNANIIKPEIIEQLTELYREHGTKAMNNLGLLEQKSIKILYLCADPINKNRNPETVRDEILRVSEEFRMIDKEANTPLYQDVLNIIPKFAVRPRDISPALITELPIIVHFSGHGVEDGAELVFHSDDPGKVEDYVPPADLRNILHESQNNIQIVVLNTCNSEVYAKALVEEIDFVIGTPGVLFDNCAPIFAATFYRELGSGKSIKDSFCNSVDALKRFASTLKHENFPKLKDENIPKLLCKRGVDPSKTFLV